MSKEYVTLFFVALFSIANSEPLQDALNGVQTFMTGKPIFDVEFYQNLTRCFASLDPRLLMSTGSQWDGMIQYANSGGNPITDDTWLQCDAQTRWFELNCTTQAYGNMPIYEPCNYASNLAYYHTSTEICGRNEWSVPDVHVKAMGMVFAILAQGSAFLHGSQTENGKAADSRINDLFAYVAYQAAIDGLGLEMGQNPIITHLANYSREQTAAEVTRDFVDMYIEVPVEEWGTILRETDFPDLRLTMCTYFVTAMTLLYPEDTVDELAAYLLELLNEDGMVKPDISEFCLGGFITEMRFATNHINLTSEEFIKLEGNLFSTVIKLFYAFLWQEKALTQDDTWLQPSTNVIGTLLLPVVNAAANELNSWSYVDGLMQSGLHMYPGEDWCNPVIPHAKWHVETSIALTDFSFLSDELYQIFTKYAGKYN